VVTVAKVNHTPEEWFFDHSDFEDLRWHFNENQTELKITHKDNHGLAVGLPRFIVRACNSHYELLEVLKEIVKDKHLSDFIPHLEKAIAAIANAEGGA
jgi:hypothetical protein